MSEGKSGTGAAAGFGKLTLGGGSTIDFGAGANGSTLLAAAGTVSGGGTISIRNWTGTIEIDNGATGNDRLLFVLDPLFSDGLLAQIQFYDDSNQLIGLGAREIAYNGFTEIVPAPVPEPAIASLLTLGAVGVASRSRRRSLRD